MKVPKHFRNSGYSFGLEYPFIYGCLPRTGKWSVWHRDTGEVVYEAETSPRLDWLGQYAASQECLRLNGNPQPDILANDVSE